MTTFENNVTKGEIAQNEQFLLLPHCFQHSSIIILIILMEILYVFANTFSKSSAADVFVCEKGLKGMVLTPLPYEHF